MDHTAAVENAEVNGEWETAAAIKENVRDQRETVPFGRS
jgi:hypothetical protein